MIMNLLLELDKILKERKLTLSIAESCTGGNIAAQITSISGCSAYFLGSVTSYSNSVKETVLGVPRIIIEEFGAVSSECVGKMAEGVRKITGSDFSIATSGIAGPNGDTSNKPVGLVWIGFASEIGTQTFCFNFSGDRIENIQSFTQVAIKTLLSLIQCELKTRI